MRQRRSKKITKLLSCVAIILCTVIFSSSVFAAEPANAKDAEINNQNQQIQPYAFVDFTDDKPCTNMSETIGKSFNTGDNRYLTVALNASATNGNPTKVTVKLQKLVAFAYINDYTVSVPITGSAQTVFNSYPVDKNTTYRLVYSCDGTQVSYAKIYASGRVWQ